MTPRERAETKPRADALARGLYISATAMPRLAWIEGATEAISEFAVEHVREVLADDEALIEAMDMAYWQGWHDEGGRLGAGTYEFCKADHSGEMGKAGARAALAVLRRKACGSAGRE